MEIVDQKTFDDLTVFEMIPNRTFNSIEPATLKNLVDCIAEVAEICLKTPSKYFTHGKGTHPSNKFLQDIRFSNP